MNRLILALGFLSFLTFTLFADDTKPKPRYETRDVHDPDGIGKFYLGREIAHVMGHQGAGWLERPEREKEEDPTKLLAALEIKPGLIAGSRFMKFPDAPATDPEYYCANNGEVIGISNFPDSMLDLPVEVSKDDSALAFNANTEKIPPLGSKVWIIMNTDAVKKK